MTPAATAARPWWRHFLATIPIVAGLGLLRLSGPIERWEGSRVAEFTVVPTATFVAAEVLVVLVPVVLIVLVVRLHRLAPAAWLIALASLFSLVVVPCSGVICSRWKVSHEVVGKDGATYALAYRSAFLGPGAESLGRLASNWIVVRTFETVFSPLDQSRPFAFGEGLRLEVEEDGTLVARNSDAKLFCWTPSAR